MATLVLKNVGRGGLDLTVGDREFVVLCGPDPADGSAIVRLLAGLTGEAQGEIHFGDRRLNEVPPKDRDLALVAHDYEPYPRLSVSENLAIGLMRRQFGEAEIKKRIAAVAAELQIHDRLEVSADTLSPPERSSLALARAMVQQPRLYLFDRPFANLGPVDAIRGRAAVAGLQQRSSSTILYAANDPAEAMALSARTVVIAGGAVEQDADAQTVYACPASLAVARFFGEPPMNLVRGTLKAERDRLIFVESGEGTIAVDLPSPRFDGATDFVGKSVVLGFRAESIEIGSLEGLKDSAIQFRALVERVELRGSLTDLYLRTGAHQLVCRTAGLEQGGGRRLQFTIDLEKADLFDPETGFRTSRER